MGKRIFMTFADTHMSKTLERIRKEAEESDFFDEILIFTEKNFEPEYSLKYSDFISTHKRGYGYWIWKSHLIHRQLLKMNHGDCLIYLDSGCEVNKGGRTRFQEYLKMANKSELGIVAFSTGLPEKKYSKGDLIDYMNVRNNPILDTAQIMGGLLIFCCKDESISLVQRWEQIVHSKLNLVDDSASVSPNDSAFVENRHDQSVLSILVKTTGGAVVLSGNEVDVFPPTNRNWRRLKKSPFLATRNRNGNPRLGKTPMPIIYICNLYWDTENAVQDTITNIRIKAGKVIKDFRRKLVKN